MLKRMASVVVAVLAVASVAGAQTPIVAGQVIEIDLASPGTRQVGTASVIRPEANVAFEYRINGATAAIPAVKFSPCTAGPVAPALVCRLVPPTLAAGTHAIEIRAVASPAETGIAPSGYMAPLGVAVIIVTSPSTPANPRVVTPAAQ
jgi:hypothetical protein